ncbi:MAG: extracellular solute-binding protein [Hungatella sp.]|nr:extracellular solute-binding protein [Hungatella sp.]
MKKRIAIILVSVLSLGLVACSGKQQAETNATKAAETTGSTAAEPVDTDKKRVITWMTVHSSWPVMDEIAANYMAEHPNVTIEFDRISDRSSYNQKVQILAANNSLPDLVDGVSQAVEQEITDTGVCVDIDELYKELGYTDRMLPIGLEWARLPNGKLYEMCWENNIEYFWYHKDMFKKAGIEVPPQTFDELIKDCQKLSDAGYAAVSVWPGWEVSRWLSFIPYRLTGNQFLMDLLAGKAKMSDETGIKTAEFLQAIGTKYYQPGWSTSDYTSALETFLSGNAAMYYIGAWQFNSFLDESGEIKEDYAYFRLPSIEGAINGENDMYINAGTGTMISKDKFDDTLKDFVAYVLNEYPDKAFWENNILPSANFDTAKGKFSSFWQAVMNDCNNQKDYAYTWDVRFDAASAEVLSKEEINLGMGSITPEEFAKRIDDALATKQ